MFKPPVSVSKEQNMQSFSSTVEHIPSRHQHSKGTSAAFNGFLPSPVSISQPRTQYNIYHGQLPSTPVSLKSNKRAHESSFDQHNQVTQKRLKFSSPCYMPNESSTCPLESGQLDSRSVQEESVGDILTRLFKEVEDFSTIHSHQSEINQPISYSEYSLSAGYTGTQLILPNHNDVSTNLHDEIDQNALQYTHTAEHKTKKERLTDFKNKWLSTSYDDRYEVIGKFCEGEQLFVKRERVNKLQVASAIGISKYEFFNGLQNYNAKRYPDYVMQEIEEKYGADGVKAINFLKKECHNPLVENDNKYEIIGKFFENNKRFTKSLVVSAIDVSEYKINGYIKKYKKLNGVK